MPSSVAYLIDNEILNLQRCPYQLTLSIEELTKYLIYNEILSLQRCPYQLTLCIEELTKSDYPPRPQNSWIIFRRDYEAYLRSCDPHVKQKVKETAKECSLKWKELSSEAIHFFKMLEEIAHENYKRIYPSCKYKPKKTKNASYKEFVFREQKSYAFVSLPMSSSLSLRNNIMNDTALTTSDSIHPFTINTNIDAAINTNIYKAFFIINSQQSFTAKPIHY
ncbi:12222_t:CDS:1 [Ambispora gerdemannii]|uniref:12222_t:CDS:1 n=1 Tax=Ambispora gerdemannii TaxID=144530 RepID=A0A9N9GCT3_9GLOM|nr:12222_t:CDS:1 [Ambispora gerdemannii]